MGGEVKTNLSDDFKAMETEMSVRHEGRQWSTRARTMVLTNVALRC